MRPRLDDPTTHHDCLQRIERLSAETQPEWGRMTAAQMLSHCAEILEVSNGKPLGNMPLVARLLKGFVRQMVVNDKPYPRNTKTHPQYRQTQDKDFEAEKRRLLEAMSTFAASAGSDIPHPLFGRMTAEEKGWAMYKHLDHHLTQFGV